MTTPKLHLVTHMGHDGPWLLLKTAKEIRERRAFIRAHKPEHERALRLRRLKIINDPLPPKLQRAYAAWDKAIAACDKADAAWDQAYAKWDKANAAWINSYAKGANDIAALAKADAAWDKAIAALNRARYARARAYAAWAKAINSSAGVKFHAQVCGCAWTPEQPDILRQLTLP